MLNKIIVIKCGGNIGSSGAALTGLAQDMLELINVGFKIVLVHGAGPLITSMMNKQKIKPKFVGGLRYTDKKIIQIVKIALTKINQQIIQMLAMHGINALSLIGCQNVIYAEQKNKTLGLVGNITKVNKQKLLNCLLGCSVAVIAPLGRNKYTNQVYNVNADFAAAQLAVSIGAIQIIFLTDVDGILNNHKLIKKISAQLAIKKIKKGIVTGGMIPKVRSAIVALNGGVHKVCLLNGYVQHALVKKVLHHKNFGTVIY